MKNDFKPLVVTAKIGNNLVTGLAMRVPCEHNANLAVYGRKANIL